jgi:uncharacterized repeat protein (TIGR01451 family)
MNQLVTTGSNNKGGIMNIKSILSVLLVGALTFVSSSSEAAIKEKVECCEKVHVIKELPGEIIIGEEFSMYLTVKAKALAKDVVLKSELPAGATYIGSNVEGKVEGNFLVWNWPELKKGEKVCIELRFRADEIRQIVSCTMINCQHIGCSDTCVVAPPKLEISKCGPDLMDICTDGTFEIKVTNVGGAAARDLVISDMVPKGLRHRSGDSVVVMKVKSLAPGETVVKKIRLKSAEVGEWVNTVTAVACKTPEVSASFKTLVIKPEYRVWKEGACEGKICDDESYMVYIQNTGTSDLLDITLYNVEDRQVKILEASEGGMIDCNVVSWKIAKLAPGEQKQYMVRVVSSSLGNRTSKVYANASTITGLYTCKPCDNMICIKPRGNSMNFQTCWTGFPGLLMEVSDCQDPEVFTCGNECEMVDYKIIIRNQGSAIDNGITLNIDMSEELQGKEGIIEVGSLKAGESKTYNIQAKPMKKGDARLRVEMRSDSLKTPVVEEESTTIL